MLSLGMHLSVQQCYGGLVCLFLFRGSLYACI